MLRVAIVDYGRGNIHSVAKALAHLGCRPEVVTRPEELVSYGPVVLPGVGAFADAFDTLTASGMAGALRDHATAGRPLLGICLGLQLLMQTGTEGGTSPGLGLIPGEVRRLEAPGRKIPHTSWNSVTFTQPSPLSAGLGTGADFYFVHSYAAFPAERRHWLGETDYGQTFAAIAGAGLTLGTQFHPEKSGSVGLRLLHNFVRIAGGEV